MMKMIFATVTIGLFTLSLCAHEEADRHDANIGNLQVTLDAGFQPDGAITGHEKTVLSVALDLYRQERSGATTQDLCDAKTFCPLD